MNQLPELLVAPTGQAASLGPRPLRAFLGKKGTVLYVPPASCPRCKTYLASLARSAPAWRSRGVALLVLNAPRGTAPSPAPGLVTLSLAGSSSGGPSLFGLLLVLGAKGSPRTIYLGAQPEPALLDQQLPSESR